VLAQLGIEQRDRRGEFGAFRFADLHLLHLVLPLRRAPAAP
jgi:hypothetical protein